MVCDSPHTNRKYNYCNDCAKCHHNKWIIDCKSCYKSLEDEFEKNNLSYSKSYLFDLVKEKKELKQLKKLYIASWQKRNNKNYYSKLLNNVWVSYGIKNCRLWLRIGDKFVNNHDIQFVINNDIETQKNIDNYLNNNFYKFMNNNFTKSRFSDSEDDSDSLLICHKDHIVVSYYYSFVYMHIYCIS